MKAVSASDSGFALWLSDRSGGTGVANSGVWSRFRDYSEGGGVTSVWGQVRVCQPLRGL